MELRRQLIIQRGSDRRPALIAPLTVRCPFCDDCLGGLAGSSYPAGLGCPCGARVVKDTPGRPWPSTPDLLVSAAREIQSRLSSAVSGHADVIGHLGIMGARHLHRPEGGQRSLLIGPSGVGKTTLANTFSEALGCPSLVWDVGSSSEAGWAGIDAGAAFSELYRSCEGDLTAMSTACAFFDEIDKLACRDATGVSRQHGQQKSLLAVLGGGDPVRFKAQGDSGPVQSLRTDRMLIMGLGVFDGLPEDPGPTDLVRHGFLTEFASRFPVILSVGRLDLDSLRTVLRRGVESHLRGAADFGYTIEISDMALGFAASAVHRGGDDVTPRAGIGWLQAAVDRALVKLIDLGASPGTTWSIQPDDLPVPTSIPK